MVQEGEEEAMEDLAPGFRFYPTEEELLLFYLHNKLHGKRQDLHRVIPVFNIYEFDPWHLPKISGELCHKDPEQWFFFTPRQEREARGGRPNRITSSGYWKATGSPCYVYSSDSQVIGLKKTMVFYKGKAPTGRKTKWKMNEYKVIEGDTASPKLRHEFSLCRIYITSGCLRSFDRRPSAAMPNETPIHQAHQMTGPATAHSSSYGAEKASSPDCSSLGEDAHLSGAEAVGDLEMTNDPRLLRELEQLNWFLEEESGIDPVAELKPTTSLRNPDEEVDLQKMT